MLSEFPTRRPAFTWATAYFASDDQPASSFRLCSTSRAKEHS